ncbi:branched-chain amino acid transport system substrate-binding protein [Maridesulfovibrio ferrireducens]|uniref:Branched-chain amino acid transport system substrate-binding protein n=1 Tax=Maridesulfovibrio ferrireducens TaxID=246191 RepID=A0A1G9FLX2_9BACT|nr:ABC transporter substrate-binding protein [Maridesulfovibrio ferrireducens]SDK89355.1 branched-chain amino acid transport system substrate-binding protein [Maridesulfovibrio ferrireducens]
MSKMILRTVMAVMVMSLAFVMLTGCSKEEEKIKIGFNIPLTGDIPKVGEASRNAAEMLKEDINSQGGLEVGGKKIPLEFYYEDNESKAESAVNVALKLIEQNGVVAIIGPNSSKQAVPAGGTCNDNRTPMVSPWSTNPDTTKNRPWVFRAAFLDPFQGPVAVNFAAKQFNAKTAAVLFDISNDYSKGLAEIFKDIWEKKNGADSVVAFVSHGTKDQDFSAQLTKIINSKPDFIFVPDNYNQVALIIKQAHDLGWTGPFMGSDAWGSSELMTLCGKDCIGQFFSTHYAAAGAKGATKEFIDRYSAKFGETPDDVAALTWDATRLVLQAIQDAGSFNSDVKAERKAIRDALSSVKEFAGITGSMKFDEQGDPIKCAVVVRIDENGQFVFAESVCP